MIDDSRTLRVLYFEDSIDDIDIVIPRTRKKYNIELVYATNAEDGLKMLEENPSKWDSIILDAKMPEKEGKQEDLATLSETRAHLFRYGIPYYIYSGHGNSIENIYKKQEWQDKVVFSKYDPEDYDLMCKNIRREYFKRQGPEAKVKIRFPEISEFVRRLKESKQDCLVNESRIVSILRNIVMDENQTRGNADSILTDIRKVLEETFWYLYTKHILPVWEGTSASGKHSTLLNEQKGIPIYIKRAFHTLAQVTNDGSHSGFSSNASSTAKLISDGKAPYLISSCCYEMLNVIHWISELE